MLLNKFNAPSNEELLRVYNSKMHVFVPYEVNEQILKDIRRTYSSTKFFTDQSGNSGFGKLHRLLVALTDYKKIGYVQGINFIAASFLWHCNEEFAYFLILRLFEKLRMEDIYSDNLLRVEKKSNEFFDLVLEGTSQEVHQKLTGLGITPLMVLAEWVITLGLSSVPIEKHMNVILGLMERGWAYFFGLLLKYFRRLYACFKDLDFGDTLNVIKNNSDKRVREQFKLSIDWDAITQL